MATQSNGLVTFCVQAPTKPLTTLIPESEVQSLVLKSGDTEAVIFASEDVENYDPNNPLHSVCVQFFTTAETTLNMYVPEGFFESRSVTQVTLNGRGDQIEGQRCFDTQVFQLGNERVNLHLSYQFKEAKSYSVWMGK